MISRNKCISEQSMDTSAHHAISSCITVYSIVYPILVLISDTYNAYPIDRGNISLNDLVCQK